MGVFVDPGEVFEAVFFCWLVVGHAVYGKKYDDGLWLDTSEICWLDQWRMLDEIHGWDMMLKRATQ